MGNYLHDLRKLGLTFSLALATGWVFLHLGMPAPFMMGSLFGVWILGSAMPKLRPHLGVARWFHVPVVLGLGVFIGSFFRGDIIAKSLAYAPTVMTMMGVTLLVTAISYAFLRRLRGYDKPTAMLCAIPGGQAEIIVVARELVEKDYVVALFHLTRVVFVFISTPLLLGAVKGQDAVDQSNDLLQSMPMLTDLTPHQLVSFFGIAMGGYALARLARIPMPHLLGPVILSAGCHAIGVIDVPRIFEFVMLAQLAIGGGVGARLAQVRFGELMGYLKDAIANTTLILIIYFTAAVMVAYLLNLDLMGVWLAFVPGGLYEVTLLAVIFGFDIAFIAFHHTIRVMLIFTIMPYLASRFRR